MFASHNNHKQVVETLIKHGADLNAINDDKQTALLLAASGNHHEICTTLATHRADINLHGGDRWTPLMIAAQRGTRGNRFCSHKVVGFRSQDQL